MKNLHNNQLGLHWVQHKVLLDFIKLGWQGLRRYQSPFYFGPKPDQAKLPKTVKRISLRQASQPMNVSREGSTNTLHSSWEGGLMLSSFEWWQLMLISSLLCETCVLGKVVAYRSFDTFPLNTRKHLKSFNYKN